MRRVLILLQVPVVLVAVATLVLGAGCGDETGTTNAGGTTSDPDTSFWGQPSADSWTSPPEKDTSSSTPEVKSPDIVETAGPCMPECKAKLCGPDGCGGSCGSCEGPAECTTSICQDGLCVMTVEDDYCLSEDVCVKGGDPQPGNPCLICEPDESTGSWSTLGDGEECADGWECFQGDCCNVALHCAGKTCGDDLCGGSCGSCACGSVCVESQCVVGDACALMECGDDGCGNSCGDCTEFAGSFCNGDGVCDCVAACAAKDCGADGCGASCGSCDESAGQFCGADGQCECAPDCDGAECGSDGCGGSCGACGPDEACLDGTCGDPALLCEGKECGDDGAGGSCGTCPEGENCVNGGCVDPGLLCQGLECGDDGAGGSCGTCGCGFICLAGLCKEEEVCFGKECGDDGCGGSCGECNEFSGSDCNNEGQCECISACPEVECGPDGCGGDCGLCEVGETCSNGVCVLPGMLAIPAGVLHMGCAVDTDLLCSKSLELPDHDVQVGAFAIHVAEVTVEAFAACVTADGCAPPPDPATVSSKCTWEQDGKEDHPINCVTWSHAHDYCEWSGYRLCSEAEWEMAARGTDAPAYIYPWGTEAPTCTTAVMKDCEVSGPEEGKSKPDGASPFGVQDMAGNVAEWVRDCWHDNYEGAPSDGSAWTSSCDAEGHVVRGGSFENGSFHLRTSARAHEEDDKTIKTIGFRCCQTL